MGDLRDMLDYQFMAYLDLKYYIVTGNGYLLFFRLSLNAFILTCIFQFTVAIYNYHSILYLQK